MGREQGSAAILGLIMIMLLGSIGATLLMLNQTDLQIATNHRDGIAAQYIAEAGVQYAVTKLKTDSEFVSQTESRNHITTSQPLGVMPTAGCYIVQTGPDPNATNTKIRLITATGVVNKAKRQVIVHVTMPLQSGEVSPLIIIWNY